MFNERIEPSLLPVYLTKAQNAWIDARANLDTSIIPVAPTLVGLCRNSTVRTPDFFGGNPNRSPRMTLTWLTACEGGGAMIVDNAWVRDYPCDFEGWTIGSNKTEITITSFVHDTFALPLMVYDNAFTRQEMFIHSWNIAVKNIIEKLNERAIATLVSYSGVNHYAGKGMSVDGGSGATSKKITKIPYRNLYPNSFDAHVRVVERMNKMQNTSLFVGGALENSEFIQGNLEQMRFGSLTTYSDLANFSKLEIENDMFLVSRGSIGVLNTWNNPSTPTPEIGGEAESVFSRELPAEYNVNGRPLMVDVTRRILKREILAGQYGSLSVDNRCEWYEVYHLELKFAFPLNPLACQDENTGIIRFRSDNSLPIYLSPSPLTQTYDVANA